MLDGFYYDMYSVLEKRKFSNFVLNDLKVDSSRYLRISGGAGPSNAKVNATMVTYIQNLNVR